MLAILALLLLETVSQINGATKITCDAPAVRKGDPANITCHFSEDVSLTKKNIKVQRQPPNSGSFDPDTVDTVVDCYWLNADDFKCNLGDGYKLIGEVGEKATVLIPAANENSEGKYMCEIVPSDPSQIESCVFQLKETGVDSLTIHIPGQYQDQLDGLSGAVTASVVISALGFIVALMILALVLFLNRKRLSKYVHKCLAAKSEDGQAEATGADEALLHDDEKDGNVSKERIEQCVQTILDMKDNGTLSHYLGDVKGARLKSDNPELVVTYNAEGASDEESESRYVRFPRVTRPMMAEGAGRAPPEAERREQPKLTEKERAKRDKDEIERTTKENAARQKLGRIMKRHEDARREQEEEDRKNNVDVNRLGWWERRKRGGKEKDRKQELEKAEKELRDILATNKKAREKQELEDNEKLQKQKKQEEREARKRKSSSGQEQDPMLKTPADEPDMKV